MIAISGPIGRAPCETHTRTSTLESSDPNGAPPHHLVVVHEHGHPRAAARAGKPSDDRQPGPVVRELGEHRGDRERVRIHEDDRGVGAIELGHARHRNGGLARGNGLEAEGLYL